MTKVAICKELGGYTVRKYRSLLFGAHFLGGAYSKGSGCTWSLLDNIKSYCVFDTLDDARNFAEGFRREIIEIVSI